MNRYSYTQNSPLLYVDPDGLAKVKAWEIGKYIVKLFPGDTFHGGTHYHVYTRTGAETLARVSAEGEVLTGSASKSLLKKMAVKGLIPSLAGGLFMFFEAAPANADDDRLKIYGIPSEVAVPLSLRLFGTEDTNELSPEQFSRLLKEISKQQKEIEKQRKKKKRTEENAIESVDSLSRGSCFFVGSCQ